MSRGNSANRALPKKNVKNALEKKIVVASSKKKITQAQTEGLKPLLTKTSNTEKLHFGFNVNLQSTMFEVVEKLVPKYREWLNSELGEKIKADDSDKICPIEQCSSSSNDDRMQVKDGGSPISEIDQMVVAAVGKVINEVVRKALEEIDQPPIMENWFEKKFYDDVSDIRPENRVYYKHYVHNFVTHYFSKELVAGRKILDFGCGPGFYSTILAQRGANVTGIDRSAFLISKAEMLKQKLGLSNVKFFHGDFLEIAANFSPKEFDYVIAIDTIVSFDYSRKEHNHKAFSQALSKINRILKDRGRFLIIEAHPFFGQLAKNITSSNKGHFHGSLPHYKIEYKHKNNPNHWFTLSEMTKALNENNMAILNIYEPDPSVELEKENPQLYTFLLKYPHLIVYEICKVRI